MIDFFIREVLLDSKKNDEIVTPIYATIVNIPDPSALKTIKPTKAAISNFLYLKYGV